MLECFWVRPATTARVRREPMVPVPEVRAGVSVPARAPVQEQVPVPVKGQQEAGCP